MPTKDFPTQNTKNFHMKVIKTLCKNISRKNVKNKNFKHEEVNS